MMLCFAVASCTGTVNTHGDKLEPDRLNELVAGQHTRDDVAAILGEAGDPVRSKKWNERIDL